MTAPLPEVLSGRYRIERLLGAGGMSTVYRARDLLHEQFSDPQPCVALKILSDDLSHSPDASAVLFNEFALIRHLRHPNILRMYSFNADTAHQRVFIVMELLQGPTLDRLLCERPLGLAWQELREIALPLLDALAHSHASGILHGDIKPSNILLSEEGVRLFDFGLGQAEAGRLDNLAAIKANLGNVIAGDLYGTTLHGGPGYPTNIYDWPTNGGLGFHLSERGLLLGNLHTGGYMELRSDGVVKMPGFTVINGKAIFSGELQSAGGTFSGRLTAEAIIAGRGQNENNTAFIDFNAIDNMPFLYAGAGAVRINANGSGYFARTVLSAPNVVANGVENIAPGWCGWDGKAYRSFTVYIDTGITFETTWNSVASATFLANATISKGFSDPVAGGCNGYSESTIVVGDGLGNAGLLPIDNRIYIRFTWTPVSGRGQIRPTVITWKLVEI